jgi:PAS domain S-box-containing protein
MRTLLEIAEGLTGALSQHDVAERVCEAVCRLLPGVDRASIHMASERQDSATLLAARGYPDDAPDRAPMLPIDASSLAGRALLTHRTQRRTDHPEPSAQPSVPPDQTAASAPPSDDDAAHTLRELAPRSMVAVPLPRLDAPAGATSGPAMGVLCLSASTRYLEHPRIRPFLSALAHVVAQALLRAQDSQRATPAARHAHELATVLESLEDAIWVVDRAGAAVAINSAAMRASGVADARDAAAQWNPLIDPHDLVGLPLPRAARPITRALAGERFTYQLIRSQHPETKREICLRVAGAPLYDAAGAIVGAVISGNDITYRLTLDRQRDIILAAAGHDLRNPLTALKGTLQMMMTHDDATVDKRHGESLRRMDRQVNRITRIVGDVMDVALLAENRLTLNRRATDLVALVREVVDEEQLFAERHTILCHPAEDSLIGQWDRDRLERVLVNLIDNAAKFSPDGGAITLRVWRERPSRDTGGGARARISIADTGHGIAAEQIERIFDWFYRAPESAATTLGSGIGLAISREVLAAHGGRIWATSPGLGRGSTFHLSLPS